MKTRAALTVVLLGIGLSIQAAAPVKPRNLAKVHQGVCAVASGPDGVVHVAYQSPDYHLWHAWLQGGKWQREPVDTTTDCGWGNSIAVDAAGRIHITYGAFRGLGAQKLTHAVRSGGTWQVTNPGVEGEQTHLALDAAANPHVLFVSGSTQKLARYEGKGWRIDDTGLPWSWYSAGLVLDSAGNAHISYAVNYDGCFYATDASGHWEATRLVDDRSAHTAIALDSQDRPHLAVALTDSLRYFRFDGSQWQSFEPWTAAMLGDVILDGVSLALGGDDRAHMLLAGSVQGTVEIALYGYDNGLLLMPMLLDAKNAGYYPRLALGPDGLAHGTYCTAIGKGSTARYVAMSLPDLAGTWVDTRFDPAAPTFAGILRIQNLGRAKSLKTDVGFVVSDDAVADAADAVLGATLKVKSLKSGGGADLRVSLTDGRLVAGRYLIAIIDPAMLSGDANAADNHVALRLP